jgi:hypothetical protein
MEVVLLPGTFFDIFVEKTRDKSVEFGEQFEERRNVSNRTWMISWGQPRHLPIEFINVAILFYWALDSLLLRFLDRIQDAQTGWGFAGQVIGQSQRPLHENTQHSKRQTSFRTPQSQQGSGRAPTS